MQLGELGKSICILGPSNSGQSTLAEAIASNVGRRLSISIAKCARNLGSSVASTLRLGLSNSSAYGAK
jgi:cytidylate kinase